MTTEQDRPLEALQIAIQMEIDGKECYLKASQESSSELGKKLLQSLATEEMGSMIKALTTELDTIQTAIDMESKTHDFDTKQYVYKMEPFELGPFNLKEAIVETEEGMRACRNYGRVFGEKLGS